MVTHLLCALPVREGLRWTPQSSDLRGASSELGFAGESLFFAVVWSRRQDVASGGAGVCRDLGGLALFSLFLWVVSAFVPVSAVLVVSRRC